MKRLLLILFAMFVSIDIYAQVNDYQKKYAVSDSLNYSNVHELIVLNLCADHMEKSVKWDKYCIGSGLVAMGCVVSNLMVDNKVANTILNVCTITSTTLCTISYIKSMEFKTKAGNELSIGVGLMNYKVTYKF